MGEITLIRHGQANTGATSEEDYDKLSDLGHQQARWLGAHFRDVEAPFDTILSGSLRRHRETSAGVNCGEPKIDERLNELDYFSLGHALEASNGTPMPDTQEGFATHVPQVMRAWNNAEIMGTETFATFETRVTAVLQESAQPGKRVLCITSGGVIAMVVRHLLGLDPTRMAHVLLPIYNSSVHRVSVTPNGTILGGYNATPHLDHPDRAHAKTHL